MSESTYKEIKQCPICGEYLTKSSNEVICDCCGFKTSINEISSYDIARLNQAYDALRSYKFDVAEEAYSLILQDNNLNSYTNLLCQWGKLLASFGVVYIKDMNGMIIPTFTEYNPNIKSIKESEIYTLIKKSKSKEKDDYLNKIEELDEIYKRIDKELNEKEMYDLFICTKISQKTPTYPDREGYTLDSKIADEFYYSLKEAGLKVFYSQKDCKGIEYDSQILSALLKSKKILIIATEKEYLESPWVQSEWRRWINFIECGIRSADSIFLYLPHYDKDSFELPRSLRKVQRFTTELQLFSLLTNKEVTKKVNKPKNVTSKHEKYREVLYEIINKHKKAIEKIVSAEKGYVYFGRYPQSKKKKSVIVTNQTRGIFFLGTDGNLYSRVEEDYYKVEPIKWKILYNYNGKMLLISDKILNSFSMSSNSYLANNWYFQDHYFDDLERMLIHGGVRYLKSDEFKNLLGFKDRFKKETDYCKACGNSNAKACAKAYANAWALEEFKNVTLENDRSGLSKPVVNSFGIRKWELVEANQKPVGHYGFVPVVELNNLEVTDLTIEEDRFEEVTSTASGKMFQFFPIIGEYYSYTHSIARVKDNSSLGYRDVYPRYSGLIVDIHAKEGQDVSFGTKLLTMYCVDIFKKEK